MKRQLLYHMCFIPLFSVAIAHGSSESTGPFQLRAHVVSALEGGPFVVQVNVTYLGKELIAVHHPSRRGAWASLSQSGIDIEKATFFDLRDRFAEGAQVRRLGKGDTLSCLVALHRAYPAIRAGKQTLRVSWTLTLINETDAKSELNPTAQLEMKVEVNVLPASSANLTACVQTLETLLNSALISRDDLDTVLEHVLNQKRPELAKVAVRLLDYDCLERYHFEIARGILGSAPTEPEGVPMLVKYLCGPSPRAIEPVFGEMIHRLPKSAVLTKETISKLKSAQTIWPRVMISVLAPNETGPDWRRQLLQELKSLKRPVPVETIKPDLTDLDSDRFLVRGKAKSRLVKKGEMAVQTLRELLESKTNTLEAETSIKAVISEIEKVPPDSVEQQIMKCLAGCLLHNWYEKYFEDDRLLRMKQIVYILEALSENHESAWVSREAKRILKEVNRP